VACVPRRQIVSEASLTKMSTLTGNVEDEYGLGLFNPAAGYAQGVGHLVRTSATPRGRVPDRDRLIVVVLMNSDDEAINIFALGAPLIGAAPSD
jgi:hypothetical protein